MSDHTENAPESEVTGRCAEEADDNTVDAKTRSEAAAKEMALADLALKSLTIEEPRSFKKEISDSDDCNVEAFTARDARFEDLNLSPELLKGLYVEMKFEKPSKIQAIILPMIMTPPFKNLVAQTRNGSGKTTCFVLGMLGRIDTQLAAPQALCICPTSELAIQAMEVLLKMDKFTGITSELSIPIPAEKEIPPVTAQVVIGTPRATCNLITLKKLSMSFMKILVFDEADRMLAGGIFKDYPIQIMKTTVQTSPDCQVLLFSATFSEVVKASVDQTMKGIFNKDYNKMFVEKEELFLDSVKQYKVICGDELTKLVVVKNRIQKLARTVGKTLIFVRNQREANMLHVFLVNLGFEVESIRRYYTNEYRHKIIKEFREGLTEVLITTGDLTRGFDEPQVKVVINYDLPVVYNKQSEPEPDYEVYLHRVGRAGRFGGKGAVFNLLNSDEEQMMEKIENYFSLKITKIVEWQRDEEYMAALNIISPGVVFDTSNDNRRRNKGYGPMALSELELELERRRDKTKDSTKHIKMYEPDRPLLVMRFGLPEDPGFKRRAPDTSDVAPKPWFRIQETCP